MEAINIFLDNGTGADYDKGLQDTLRDGGVITLITKDKGTRDGNPIVMVTFTVQMPDGSLQRVQSATTVKNFLNAAIIINGRYPGVRHGP